jgi:hypothetical protein
VTAGSRPGARHPFDRFVRLRIGGMTALLALLVASVFVVPAVTTGGAAWHVVGDIVVALILLSGVLAVTDHPRTARALAVLGVIAIVVRGLEWIAPVAMLPPLREGSTLIALSVLAFAVGINVFGPAHPLRTRIIGAIVLYLLVGVTFAVVYAFLDTVGAGSFAGRTGVRGDMSDWVYFSFVTLTTVGFGDIAPVSQSARAVTILEALMGQLYPAVIIARLISLNGDQK